MKKTEAIQLVKRTFDGVFDESSFEVFIVNLLKSYTIKGKVRKGQYIREAFQGFVSRYKILGDYEDAEKNQMAVLEVYLHRGGSLERARTAQRNFVSDYLKRNDKTAALVAFISPDQTDWRFSLVKLEYSPEFKEGKLKLHEEITPAKRWSFLVGQNEGSHTVQSRFISLLESDEEPALAELEEAFNIESVTDEFFKKYCDLFYRMKEAMDELLVSDPVLESDFQSKELSTVDFAKKTLGQMAFLYFLQKKGWFGVNPKKEWGTGTKNFLRELFGRRQKYGKNFFDDILEPLFYEALAQDRGVESIYPRLNNCRMPFLNGGLFEPMNGYSWETTHIRLPDTLFSNENRTKEGDIGDGILDIFDRYNFTVNENEPLEKEVAVDPEMLGKVFENLLEIKDRKSKGAFYTPREIVHYMCQESLINYLHTETGETIPREDLETLIQCGSEIIQNDTIVLEKGREGTYKFMLPKRIRAKVEGLDKALADIKVCDPAVGSGAFPLGMLNEIIQARQALGVHLRGTQSAYDLKLHSISNSIYGVDIDPGAVEIAKLRLWLALVVEETEPHPLPNLEHKIMQGNSLLSEYEGIKLFDDSFLEHADSAEKEREDIEGNLSRLQREYFALHGEGNLTKTKKRELEREIKALSNRKKSLDIPRSPVGREMSIFDAPSKYKEAQEKTERLQKKIELFISESRKTQKQLLKADIDTLKWELIEATLKDQGKLDKLAEIEKLRHRNIRPFFVWKLEFADVFKENGGFDIVIANPPYVGEKGNKDTFRPIAQGNLGKFYQGKMDLFYFFFHLAINIGKNNSQNAFITTNYYITASGGRKLRQDLNARTTIRSIINFNELRIFESALGQHNMITLFTKRNSSIGACKTTTLAKKGTATDTILKDIFDNKYVDANYVSVPQEELFEGKDLYIRPSGREGNKSEIFRKFTSNTILLSDLCSINQGIVSGADKLTAKHLEKYGVNGTKGNGIFVLTQNEVAELNLNEYERGHIKPFYKNSQIFRYHISEGDGLSILYVTKDIDIKRCPNLMRHLQKYKRILEDKRECKTGKLPWYSLHWPRKINIFEHQKIVNSRRSYGVNFAFEEYGRFEQSDIMLTSIKEEWRDKYDYRYLLGILNSNIINFWLYNKGKRKGEMLELYYQPLSEIPIKKLSYKEQIPFIEIVDEILKITKSHEYSPQEPPLKQRELEGCLDRKLFELYELTDSERILVEGN